MSHNPEAIITCPNCGYDAKYNYCAQCGQETHLHKETFFGLVMHFVAHYFHYDSKFWKTMKTLIVKPGALTIAYWDKQRARYIPPISLYIFISTIYFISTLVLFPAKYKVIQKEVSQVANQNTGTNSNPVVIRKTDPTSGNMVITTTSTEKAFKTPEEVNAFVSTVTKQMPKAFFFLVPFLGFVLQLLFFRRKDLFFVDHAVFSIHLHCMYFTTSLVSELLQEVYPSMGVMVATGALMQIVMLCYAIMAMSRTYKISTGGAILNVLLMMLMYGVVALIIAFGFTYYIISQPLAH